MTALQQQDRRTIIPVSLTRPQFDALSKGLHDEALQSESMANLLSEHARESGLSNDCMGAQFDMLGVLLLGGPDGKEALKLSSSGSLRAQLVTDGESFALIYQEKISKDATRITVPIRVEVVTQADLPFLQVKRPSTSDVFLLRAAILNWIVAQHASLCAPDKLRAQGLSRAMAKGGGGKMQEDLTRLLDDQEPAEAILAPYFATTVGSRNGSETAADCAEQRETQTLSTPRLPRGSRT